MTRRAIPDPNAAEVVPLPHGLTAVLVLRDTPKRRTPKPPQPQQAALDDEGDVW